MRVYFCILQGQYGYTVGANLQRENHLWGAVNGGHHVIAAQLAPLGQHPDYGNHNVPAAPGQQPPHLHGGQVAALSTAGGPLEGTTARHPLLHAKGGHMANNGHFTPDNPVDLSSRHGNGHDHGGLAKQNGDVNININGKRPHDFDSHDDGPNSSRTYTVNHNGVTRTVSVGIPNRSVGEF